MPAEKSKTQQKKFGDPYIISYCMNDDLSCKLVGKYLPTISTSHNLRCTETLLAKPDLRTVSKMQPVDVAEVQILVCLRRLQLRSILAHKILDD